MAVLDTNPESARETARTHMSVYLRAPNYRNNLLRLGFTEDDLDGPSDRLVDAIVAWGDVGAVVDRVRAHHDAGANHVCVQPLVSGFPTLPEDQLRELASALLD
jgi:probable F420-dependent oxidoreductase